MGKKNKLYVVVFAGVYPGSESDHNVGIYTKKSDAVKEFRRQIADTKNYYKNELKAPFDFFRDVDCCSFRVGGEYEDSVDIFIVEIAPDDGMKSFVF